MSEKRVVLVVDMQNGVFKTPRHQSEKCVSLINQLTQLLRPLFSYSILKLAG